MNCPHCGTSNAEGARFCGKCGQATTGTEPQSHAGVAPPASALPDLVGKEIAGRYRVLAKLGEGGMGAVYRAEQISLKRTVAIKVLRPEIANSDLLVRRFNAEAHVVAKLDHPNTVRIIEQGQDVDGSLFIAMEFIEGKSLRQVVHREAPLPPRRALWIASQICASLVDAHSRSIIHRDLKPDNVMLQDRGRERDIVRVLDFGIAKLRDDSRQTQMQMTQAGDMLGTPQYMAPEQIRGDAIDGRTDIYAVGCIIYEMITGRLPFEAPTVMALLSKHLMENPLPPSVRRPELGVPPAIDNLVMQAMAKDPNARLPTMEAMSDLVGALLAQLPLDSATGHHPVASAAQPVATPYSPTPAVSPGPGGPYTPPRAIETPVAPSAYQSPPPLHHTDNPYAPHAGHAQAPYNPVSPPAPASPPVQAKRSGKWILALVGVLAVAGGGAGIYFGVIRNSSATPGQPTSPASPDPDPFAVTSSDPTLRKVSDPFAARQMNSIASNLLSSGNVVVELPAGYTFEGRDPATDVVYAFNGKLRVAIQRIPATGDPDDIARMVAEQSTYTSEGTQYFLGQQRPFYSLSGVHESGLPTRGVFVLLQGPTYSAAVGLLAIGDDIRYLDEESVQTWEARIKLP